MIWFQQKPTPQLSILCLIQDIKNYVQINTYWSCIVRSGIFINLASNILLLASKKCFLTSQGLVRPGMNCRALLKNYTKNVHIILKQKKNSYLKMQNKKNQQLQNQALYITFNYFYLSISLCFFILCSFSCTFCLTNLCSSISRTKTSREDSPVKGSRGSINSFAAVSCSFLSSSLSFFNLKFRTSLFNCLKIKQAYLTILK